MFTGIIRHTAIVKSVKKSDKKGSSIVIDIELPIEGIKVGDSVAVNGVCLTVVELNNNIARFELVRETVDRTTLGSLKEGDIVNIEESLKIGDKLDGHFVLGHVDGIAEIVDKKELGDQTVMRFKVKDKNLLKYIASKGCIAIDGVSLTIVDVNDTFSVTLIPHTLANTTLGLKKVGDLVNVEVDILSKYVERHLLKK